MNNRGQGILVFCLALSAIIASLIGSLMISHNSMNSQVRHLKVRTLGYQASIQIAQLIQQGRSNAIKFPACIGLAGQSLTTINGENLCLPNGSICVESQFKYCIAKNPNFLISALSVENETLQAEESSWWERLQFSFMPEAKAQSLNRSWMPTLVAPPTATLPALSCATENTCAICKTAPNDNAACFKVRICTNGSDNCPDKKDYYETLIAIMYAKT